MTEQRDWTPRECDCEFNRIMDALLKGVKPRDLKREKGAHQPENCQGLLILDKGLIIYSELSTEGENNG